MKELDRLAKEYSNAHVRLNMFYAVIELLEGGTLPGGSGSAGHSAERIITICKAEAQKQLRIHDAALEKMRGLLP